MHRLTIKTSRSHKKAPRIVFLKSIALTVILCLLFQEFSYAAPELLKTDFGSWVADRGEKQRSLEWAKKLLPVISESVATIEDAWSGGDKVVILIQDAHTNSSCQSNEAKLFDLLFKSRVADTVFTEAAKGNANLSFLRDRAPLSQRKAIAQEYLQKGLLHGIEYLDLTSDHDFKVEGVEDPALYYESIKVYQQTVQKREGFEGYLNKIETSVDALKPRLLNPLLLAFLEKYKNSQKEDANFSDYIGMLFIQADVHQIDLKDLPNLLMLKELKKLESKIDFNAAGREQQKAIQSLSPENQRELSGLSVSKISLKESQKGFFFLLKEKLAQNVIASEAKQSRYPELTQYFEYLEKSNALNPHELLKEKKSLEDRIFKSLVTHEDESKLLLSIQVLNYYRKLFHLSLTPEEYQEFSHDMTDLKTLTGFLNKKLMLLNDHYDKALFLNEDFSDMLTLCKRFYELTYERDEKFVENILLSLRAQRSNPDTASTAPRAFSARDDRGILITGGYHAPNLKYLLKKKGISYISIVPQVTHETNVKRYEEILLSQPTPSIQKPYLTSALTKLTMNEYVSGEMPSPISAQFLKRFESSPVLVAARLAEANDAHPVRKGIQYTLKAGSASLLAWSLYNTHLHPEIVSIIPQFYVPYMALLALWSGAYSVAKHFVLVLAGKRKWGEFFKPNAKGNYGKISLFSVVFLAPVFISLISFFMYLKKDSHDYVQNLGKSWQEKAVYQVFGFESWANATLWDRKAIYVQMSEATPERFLTVFRGHENQVVQDLFEIAIEDERRQPTPLRHINSGLVKEGSVIALLSKMGPQAVDYLVANLSSEDPVRRVVAVLTLWKMDPAAKEAVPALIQILEKSENVKLVVDTLEKIHDNRPEVIRALVKLIRSDKTNQYEAVYTLSKLGQPGVKALVKELRHGDAGLQQNIVSALDDMWVYADAILVLIETMKGAGNEADFRKTLQAILSTRKAPLGILPQLSHLVADSDPRVSEEASKVIYKMRENQDINRYLVEKAIKSIDESDRNNVRVQEAIQDLLNYFINKSQEPTAIPAQPDQWTETDWKDLFDKLKSGESIARTDTEKQLSLLGPEEARNKIQELVRVMNEMTDTNDRDFLLRFILTKTDSVDRAPILTPLLQDKDAEIQKLAIIMFGHYQVKSVEPELLKFIHHRDERVRRAAVSALGRIGSKKAIRSLIDILSDEKEDVFTRSEAAEALGAMGHDSLEAVPDLLKVINHTDEYFRRNAIWGLERVLKEMPYPLDDHLIIPTRSGVDREIPIQEIIEASIKGFKELPRAWASILINIGIPSVESVVKGLGQGEQEDTEFSERKHVLREISQRGEMEKKAVLNALEQLIKTNRDNPKTLFRAEELLKKINEPVSNKKSGEFDFLLPPKGARLAETASPLLDELLRITLGFSDIAQMQLKARIGDGRLHEDDNEIADLLTGPGNILVNARSMMIRDTHGRVRMYQLKEGVLRPIMILGVHESWPTDPTRALRLQDSLFAIPLEGQTSVITLNQEGTPSAVLLPTKAQTRTSLDVQVSGSGRIIRWGDAVLIRSESGDRLWAFVSTESGVRPMTVLNRDTLFKRAVTEKIPHSKVYDTIASVEARIRTVRVDREKVRLLDERDRAQALHVSASSNDTVSSLGHKNDKAYAEAMEAMLAEAKEFSVKGGIVTGEADSAEQIWAIIAAQEKNRSQDLEGTIPTSRNKIRELREQSLLEVQETWKPAWSRIRADWAERKRAQAQYLREGFVIEDGKLPSMIHLREAAYHAQKRRVEGLKRWRTQAERRKIDVEETDTPRMIRQRIAEKAHFNKELPGLLRSHRALQDQSKGRTLKAKSYQLESERLQSAKLQAKKSKVVVTPEDTFETLWERIQKKDLTIFPRAIVVRQLARTALPPDKSVDIDVQGKKIRTADPLLARFLKTLSEGIGYAPTEGEAILLTPRPISADGSMTFFSIVNPDGGKSERVSVSVPASFRKTSAYAIPVLRVVDGRIYVELDVKSGLTGRRFTASRYLLWEEGTLKTDKLAGLTAPHMSDAIREIESGIQRNNLPAFIRKMSMSTAKKLGLYSNATPKKSEEIRFNTDSRIKVPARLRDAHDKLSIRIVQKTESLPEGSSQEVWIAELWVRGDSDSAPKLESSIYLKKGGVWLRNLEEPLSLYENYYRALRKLMPSNSDGTLTVISGAAGPSVKHLYLSTGFTKAYLIDRLQINPQRLSGAVGQLTNPDRRRSFNWEQYRAHNVATGFSHYGSFYDDVEFYLLKELQELGTPIDSMVFSVVGDAPQRVRINFTLEDKPREIEWISADFKDLSPSLEAEFLQKADAYYQKAAQSLPLAYESYLYRISHWVKPGGLLLLNDVTDTGQRIDSGSFLGPGEFESASTSAIEKAERRVERALGINENSPAGVFYGWKITPMRRRNSRGFFVVPAGHGARLAEENNTPAVRFVARVAQTQHLGSDFQGRMALDDALLTVSFNPKGQLVVHGLGKPVVIRNYKATYSMSGKKVEVAVPVADYMRIISQAQKTADNFLEGLPKEFFGTKMVAVVDLKVFNRGEFENSLENLLLSYVRMRGRDPNFRVLFRGESWQSELAIQKLAELDRDQDLFYFKKKDLPTDFRKSQHVFMDSINRNDITKTSHKDKSRAAHARRRIVVQRLESGEILHPGVLVGELLAGRAEAFSPNDQRFLRFRGLMENMTGRRIENMAEFAEFSQGRTQAGMDLYAIGALLRISQLLQVLRLQKKMLEQSA